MKLLIDSREKLPLEFKDGFFDSVEVRGLPVADYWLELDGTEVPLAFERKSLQDLFGTMTKGYERWKKMLDRANSLGMTIILLIEGSMRDIARGIEYSSFSGDSMLKKLAMLKVRYDLEWHCFQDRREMARYIEEIFDAIKRNYKK